MAGENIPAEDQRVKLRSYQQELLQKSIGRNVIIAMPTGSGKTHIAVARIRAELECSEPGKLVWFMAPNKSLSEQQYNVFLTHMPMFNSKLLTGADNVDHWTSQDLWDAFLAGVHLVVGTPAVLFDALTHGFVKISRLSLLVFDEAHRCVKNNPMNQIMRGFYHPAESRGEPVPKIMALSASPVMSSNARETGLQAIERNLNSSTITPKQFRGDMEAYSNAPKLIKVVYESTLEMSESPAYDALVLEVQSYDINQDPYVLDLREQGDAIAQQRLLKVFDKGKTYCTEQMRALQNRAAHIGEQLGRSMAEWLVCTSVNRFLDSGEGCSSLVIDVETKERRHLEGILRRVIAHAADPSTLKLDIHRASNKAKALYDILLASETQNSRTVIFVEQRTMVITLAQLLRSSELSRSRSIATFVGTSTFVDRKTSLGDLVDHKMHAQDLQAFRDGSKTLMIATSVLEEGIDIPACNGVICFDLPRNLISFVQRRGRARQIESQYILLVGADDPQSDPELWQELERKMTEAYQDEERDLKHLTEAEGDDDEDASSIKYVVPSTGAMLTIDNSRSHLEHFCATSTLVASRYIDPRPEFDVVQQFASGTWEASVTLPSFVHSSLRTAKSTRPWHGRKAAIKEAAFNAYVALHKAGLVNDNLLPPFKDPRAEMGQQHVDQSSLVQISEQQSAWSMCGENPAHSETSWYASKIELHLSHREVLSQILWLPFPVGAAEKIKLCWNSSVCYEANVTPVDCGLFSAEQRNAASKWTTLVLRSIYTTRMPDDQRDLPFWLNCPPNVTDYESNVSSECIHQHLSVNAYADCGIVRVKSRGDRAYILRGVCEAAVDERSDNFLDDDLQLIVTPFPKRRDFLHQPHDDDDKAYTSRQFLPMSQCSISRLPLRFSLLAVFLPSIIHHIDTVYVAQHLNTTTLSSVAISKVELVLQSLCSPAAREQIGDYNRLEYLGDTILKLCTELQVVAQHPTWPESFLSGEKDRIVRNSNLGKASLKAGLDRYILTKPFTGSKWRPSHLRELMTKPLGQREMSSKVLADVVEALIGAAYVDGGLPKAHECIKTLLPNETWWDFDLVFSTILDEAKWTGALNLSHLEELIGRRFHCPSLLLEALTHASYQNSRTGLSYERLEFLGDAVLDLIITPKLYAHERKLRHWDLHRVHEALVNGYFLGFCCLAFSGEQQSYDIVNNSARGIPHMEPRARAKIYHLYDFIRASGEVTRAKTHAVSRFDSLHERIATALQKESGIYPWADLTALQPDKFFSDIVESILGAIYIDARGDLGACESFLEKLGITPIMRAFLDRHVDTTFPKERVGLLADRENVKYYAQRVEQNAEDGWDCTVVVGSREVAGSGKCRTREEAEVRAAEVAALELAAAMKERGGGRSKKREPCSREVHELRDVENVGAD